MDSAGLPSPSLDSDLDLFDTLNISLDALDGWDSDSSAGFSGEDADDEGEDEDTDDSKEDEGVQMPGVCSSAVPLPSHLGHVI